MPTGKRRRLLMACPEFAPIRQSSRLERARARRSGARDVIAPRSSMLDDAGVKDNYRCGLQKPSFTVAGQGGWPPPAPTFGAPSARLCPLSAAARAIALSGCPAAAAQLAPGCALFQRAITGSRTVYDAVVSRTAHVQIARPLGVDIAPTPRAGHRRVPHGLVEDLTLALRAPEGEVSHPFTLEAATLARAGFLTIAHGGARAHRPRRAGAFHVPHSRFAREEHGEHGEHGGNGRKCCFELFSPHGGSVPRSRTCGYLGSGPRCWSPEAAAQPPPERSIDHAHQDQISYHPV